MIKNYPLFVYLIYIRSCLPTLFSFDFKLFLSYIHPLLYKLFLHVLYISFLHEAVRKMKMLTIDRLER